MISDYQNKMADPERIRGATAEAFRDWHAGKPLTEEQKRLIRDASVDHNLRAFDRYLAQDGQIPGSKHPGNKQETDRG